MRKLLMALLVLLPLMAWGYTKIGGSPWCLFDGYTMECDYVSHDDCERERIMRAKYGMPDYRCVANPQPD